MKPLFRYVSARVDKVEEAEDITEEVFMAALESINRLRASDEIGLLGWLFQIARNKIADYHRRRYRNLTLSLDQNPGPELSNSTTEAAQEDWIEGANLQQALEKLTREQREVIMYKFVLGYPNEDAARLLGKTPNAINALQHRALKSLRRILGAQG